MLNNWYITGSAERSTDSTVVENRMSAALNAICRAPAPITNRDYFSTVEIYNRYKLTQEELLKYVGIPDKKRALASGRYSGVYYYQERIYTFVETETYENLLSEKKVESKLSKEQKCFLEAKRRFKWLLDIKDKNPAQLLKAATIHYNRVNPEAPYACPVTSDPAFLGRIVCNYIRHQCTNYDAVLAYLSGRSSIGDARLWLRNHIRSELSNLLDFDVED